MRFDEYLIELVNRWLTFMSVAILIACLVGGVIHALAQEYLSRPYGTDN